MFDYSSVGNCRFREGRLSNEGVAALGKHTIATGL